MVGAASKADEQIDIAAKMIFTARPGAEQNCERDSRLGAQGCAQAGEKRPVTAKIRALCDWEVDSSGRGTVCPDKALSKGTPECPVSGVQLGSELWNPRPHQ